jgi:hypothetical protein
MAVFGVNAPLMTRPNDTTAYASGDLVANNTTAGSVVPLDFNTEGGGSYWLHRIVMRSSNPTVTNKNYRLFLFGTSPVVSNGDNGAFAVTNANGASSLFAILGSTTPISTSTGGSSLNVFTPLDSVGTFLRHAPIVVPGRFYGLLVANAAYTPTALETFACAAELETP